MGSCNGKDTFDVGPETRIPVRLMEVPDAEVLILNETGEEGGVTEQGRLQVLALRPKSKKDRPGKYRLTYPGDVTSQMRHTEEDVFSRLDAGTCIDVVQIVRLEEDKRVRMRLEDPAGWMSLQNTQNNFRWAEKLEVGVLFVGDSDFVEKTGASASEEDKKGFYYPLVSETPVVFDWDRRIITLSAGDGDVFAIRLPPNLPNCEALSEQLVETLADMCNFRLEKQVEAADHVRGFSMKIIDKIEKAADGLSSKIQRSGNSVRTNLPKTNEIEVGLCTKLIVGATAGATKTTVRAVDTVVDVFSGAVMLVGREVGKRAVPDAGQGSSSSRAGKAALIGGLQIFDALITAAEQVGTAAVDETEGVVSHRYGKEAGHVTRRGLSAAGNTIQLMAAEKTLGKKAAGKLAAKSALYTIAARGARGVIEGSAAQSAARKPLPTCTM